MAKARTNDPILKFATYLKEVGLLDVEKEEAINEQIMNIVNDATDYAENAPYANAEHALKFVYAEAKGE